MAEADTDWHAPEKSVGKIKNDDEWFSIWEAFNFNGRGKLSTAQILILTTETANEANFQIYGENSRSIREIIVEAEIYRMRDRADTISTAVECLRLLGAPDSVIASFRRESSFSHGEWRVRVNKHRLGGGVDIECVYRPKVIEPKRTSATSRKRRTSAPTQNIDKAEIDPDDLFGIRSEPKSTVSQNSATPRAVTGDDEILEQSTNLAGLFCFLFVLLPIGWIMLSFTLSARRRNARISAGNAYQRSLNKLEGSPNNPQLRRQCLAEGRYYARLCREQGLETIFDELAIKNDIDAACAASFTGGTIDAELVNPVTWDSSPRPPTKRTKDTPKRRPILGGCTSVIFWILGLLFLIYVIRFLASLK